MLLAAWSSRVCVHPCGLLPCPYPAHQDGEGKKTAYAFPLKTDILEISSILLARIEPLTF